MLKWRQATPGAAWEGYIAVTAPDDDGWALITLWVSSAMLDQA